MSIVQNVATVLAYDRFDRAISNEQLAQRVLDAAEAARPKRKAAPKPADAPSPAAPEAREAQTQTPETAKED